MKKVTWQLKMCQWRSLAAPDKVAPLEIEWQQKMLRSDVTVFPNMRLKVNPQIKHIQTREDANGKWQDKWPVQRQSLERRVELRALLFGSLRFEFALFNSFSWAACKSSLEMNELFTFKK